LPTIDNNIRLGNSLVDADFYSGEIDFGDGQIIKPFSWRDEFKDVFKQGGFDVVVGNPPYVVLEDMFRDEGLLSYLRSHYDIASYKVDLYHLFFEKGISLLNKKGTLGYITPSNYLTNNGLIGLRNLILTKSFIQEINIIAGRVFEDASVDTSITILNTSKPFNPSQLKHAKWQGYSLEEVSATMLDTKAVAVTKEKLLNSTTKVTFTVKTAPLSDNYSVKFGMQLRDRKKYPGDVIRTTDKNLITTDHQPCYTGKDFTRYQTHYNGLLAYCNTEAKRGGCWDESVHSAAPKVLVRQIGKTPVCSLDTKGYHCLNTLFMIAPKASSSLSAYFLLGILNSRLMSYYWLNTFYDMRGTFPKVKGTYLGQLPIPELNFKVKADSDRHDKIADLAEHLLNGYEQLSSITIPSVLTQAKTKLKYQERTLEGFVYDLYNLSNDERNQIDTLLA
ncbi:MAG: hypothetical protein EOP45_09470, partial [Sphingobacteriaceae bacterium]